MAVYKRIQTCISAELEVPAPAFWAILLDWPGVMSWWPTDNPPSPLIRVNLRQGQHLGTLPVTRDCYFDVSQLGPGADASSLPTCVSETLLHVDEAARMIYYKMEGVGPFGMRNYLATTEVDDLGQDRCRATCWGRFDLPDDAPGSLVKTFIESSYKAILDGISARVASLAQSSS